MIIGFIITKLPIIAIISFVFYLPLHLWNTHKYVKVSFLYSFVRYVFIVYILSLIYLTILWYYPNITFHPEHHFMNLRPFRWMYEGYEMGTRRMITQLVLNIGMFIPFGILLPLILHEHKQTLVIIFVSTFSIEMLQYFIGRSADIDDVIMNLFGGILGYITFWIIKRLLNNQKWYRDTISCETTKKNLEM